MVSISLRKPVDPSFQHGRLRAGIQMDIDVSEAYCNLDVGRPCRHDCNGGRLNSDLKDAATLLGTQKKNGQKLNVAMACASPEAIKRAVLQGLGIGFLYYDAVRDSVDRGSFKIINIRGLDLVGQTYIIYHKERSLSPNAVEFLKVLREWRDRNGA